MRRPFGLFCDIGAVESTRLVMTVTDNLEYVRYGDVPLYWVTLYNPNPLVGAVDVHVTTAGSEAMDNASADWVFYPDPCPDPCFLTQNPGHLDTTVTIAPNTTLTWSCRFRADAASPAGSATLSAHASGAAIVSDVDTLVLFRNGFESQSTRRQVHLRFATSNYAAIFFRTAFEALRMTSSTKSGWDSIGT